MVDQFPQLGCATRKPWGAFVLVSLILVVQFGQGGRACLATIPRPPTIHFVQFGQGGKSLGRGQRTTLGEHPLGLSCAMSFNCAVVVLWWRTLNGMGCCTEKHVLLDNSNCFGPPFRCMGFTPGSAVAPGRGRTANCRVFKCASGRGAVLLIRV